MTKRTRAWVRNFVDYSALAVFLVAYFLTGRNITTATWARDRRRRGAGIRWGVAVLP